MGRSAYQRSFVFDPGDVIDIEADLSDGTLTGSLGEVAVRRIDADTIAFREADGRWVRAVVQRVGDETWIAVEGEVFVAQSADIAVSAGPDTQAAFATSPMTGVVVKVSVEPGQSATEGQELFVVEAMKMEYVVRAPREVVVDEVRATAGASVDLGEVLVIYRSDE